MPKGTYSNVKNAIRNAKYIIKKTKCDAVKLESNNNNYNVIKKISKFKYSSDGACRIHSTI